MRHPARTLALACLASLALVTPGSTHAAVRGPRLGYLRILIRNVPEGTSPHVVLTGPRGYRLVIERTRRLQLEAGTYRLAAPTIHSSTFDAAPVRAAQRVAVSVGKEAVTTVSYRTPVPRAAPPTPGTAPTVTAVTGTSPAPSTTAAQSPSYVWIGVTFADPECDVIGGTWIGAGEAIGDFGKWGRPDLMRNLSCADGVGSLEFARTCTAARLSERVLLVDATGRRSVAAAYTLACS